MDIKKITDATYLGVASATLTLSGITLISVPASNSNSDAMHPSVVAKVGLSGIAIGVVLGLMTAYLAVNAYLSTHKD